MAYRIENTEIKRILLVRPDAIGDVVLCIPAIVAMKRRYPVAHISVLARSYTVDLLKHHPAVDEVIIDAYAEKRIAGIAGFFRYVKDLKSSNFDLVIYFYQKSHYVLAGALAGIPIRIGDLAKPFYSWLNTAGIRQRWRDVTRHEVEHNLDLAKVAGVETSEPDMQVHTSEENQNWAEEKLRESGIQSDDFVIGIHLGTGGTNKPWHVDGYAEVMNKLNSEFKIKWVITGGKSEESMVCALLQQVNSAVTNLTNRTTLGQLIGIMKRYNLYMSVDTGPLHIAAGLKIPTVLISPTKNGKPSRWGPWGTRQKVVRKPLNCSLRCIPRDCREMICQPQTTPDEVADAVRELINGGGNISREEIFIDWCRKSINIMLICLDKDKKHKALLEIMRKQGINVNYVDAEDSTLKEVNGSDILPASYNPRIFKNYAKLIEAYDINVIHFVGARLPKAFRAILSKAAYPALVLENDLPEDMEKANWLDFYIRKFQEI